MGRLEVQGIVAANTREPVVQCRMLDDDDNETAKWQATVGEAREMAQQLVEAAMNATYDAAIFTWAIDEVKIEEHAAYGMLDAVRRFRADTWGLPDRPEDWRP